MFSLENKITFTECLQNDNVYSTVFTSKILMFKFNQNQTFKFKHYLGNFERAHNVPFPSPKQIIHICSNKETFWGSKNMKGTPKEEHKYFQIPLVNLNNEYQKRVLGKISKTIIYKYDQYRANSYVNT